MTFLIAAGILAAWIISLYVHPFGKCWRCRGRRVIIRDGCTVCRWLTDSKKRKGGRPKAVTCPACKGVGRAQRHGSRIVCSLARRAGRELARSRNPRRLEGTYTDANRNL
jgi:hypothetical protein